MPEFTVPDGIRPTDLDRFLDLLITGGNMDHALRQVDADGLALRRFARQAGFPSRQPMRDARKALRELYPEIAGMPVDPAAEEEAKAAHPAFQQPPTGKGPIFRNVTATLTPASATKPESDAVDQDPVPHAAILQESVAAVARAAAESGSKSLTLAGERFVKAHDSLVAGLRDHADRAAKEQRISELQAELARLRGKSSPAASTSTDAAPASRSKQVRAWAAEQGIDCPKVGHVPERVQQAYDAAHEAS